MLTKFLLPLLLSCFFSCKRSNQNSTYSEIKCDGIDLVSLGENVDELKTKLANNYELEEYEEAASSYLYVIFENNDFISIGYYKNIVFTIGLFSTKYRLNDNIRKGMDVEELSLLIPNLKILINHYDDTEFIEYHCNNNVIEILVNSTKEDQAYVGIYSNKEDETYVFNKDATVSGFILRVAKNPE